MSVKVLLKEKKLVDKGIQKYLQQIKKSALHDPIAYSLLSGGKRLRPILVKLMASSVGKGFDVTPSAVAIELFHTASLIADDLPCMDDDDYRRGSLSLHKKYKESTALLSSFALLTEGFSQIEKNSRLYFDKGYGTEGESDKRLRIALKETTKLSGPSGVVLGQYLDVEQTNTQTEQDFERLYYLKTGTLFQGAFTLGYIFGGGDLEKIHLVERLSTHLGLAFQIRDDLEDMDEQTLSYPKKFGEDVARKRCKKEIEGFFKALDQLNLNKIFFDEIILLLFQDFL